MVAVGQVLGRVLALARMGDLARVLVRARAQVQVQVQIQMVAMLDQKRARQLDHLLDPELGRVQEVPGQEPGRLLDPGPDLELDQEVMSEGVRMGLIGM